MGVDTGKEELMATDQSTMAPTTFWLIYNYKVAPICITFMIL